ncbi:MAG: hypothetical protein CMK07_02840 [Ponticaulis sp.]|nr:hypothetical protein [Ponticaulis sp.]
MIRIIGLIALFGIAMVGLAFAGLYGLSEAKLHDVSYDVAFDTPIPTDAASIEHGRHIARTRGCFGCHGQDLQGKDFGEQWDWPKRAVAPNLADYARNHDDATLEAAIRQGIGSGGRALMSMPSFNFARLTDEDTAALIAFLRSAPVVKAPLPSAELGWLVRWDIVRGAETGLDVWADAVPALEHDPETEPGLAHGEYLAMTMCNECHGLDLRGEWMWGPGPPDLYIVSALDRAEFEQIITTGTGQDGRDLGLMGLVAPDRFPELSQDEIDDLYLFLSSLEDKPVPENVFWRPE